MKEIRSESKLTFFEATSIIVGHGVGSGILSVPFLASRTVGMIFSGLSFWCTGLTW